MHAIKYLNEFENNDIQYDNSIIEIYISATISQIMYYINISEDFDPKFYLLVKAMFHKYIFELGYTHLITYYNKIFNDNLYDDKSICENKQPTLSSEWINEKIREYQTKQLQIERRKLAKRPPLIYKVGSHVGAQDKEGKWWLSKILAVFYKNEHIIYYVEFLNWGEQFNEFITDPAKIQSYNSRKHHLFKPVDIM
jgi:hypothetical protein